MLLWLQRGLAFGLVGLLIECIFTGIRSWFKKDIHGTSKTFLSAIPVYGFAGLILECIKTQLLWSAWALVIPYLLVIYGTEFLFGYIYEKYLKGCPWHYGLSKWTPMGLINIKYLPFWILVALGFNKVSSILYTLVKLINVVDK